MIEPVGIANFDKDPNAVLDYVFDWTEWLGEDTVASHEFLVSPSNHTDCVEVDSSDEDEGIITVWVSKGRAGSTYKLTCRVVTAGGRTEDRTVNLRMKHR